MKARFFPRDGVGASDFPPRDDVLEVSLLLPAQAVQLLDSAANRRDWSIGELLRHVIEGFLKSEAGAPPYPPQ